MKKLALALVLVVALVSQCALAEAEEPVTLSILVCRNAAVNVPAEENEAWKYAAEQNGVVLEFTEIDSSVCRKIKQHLIIVEGILRVNELHTKVVLLDLLNADLEGLFFFLLVTALCLLIRRCRHADHGL